jgi:hypothetical protein
VCGTATNAFINLAASGGLPARRILLLNANQGAKHVDAEVLVNGRWIVVDPGFRTILRTRDGSTLTKDQLASPAVFLAVTQNIPRYDPDYSFERTTHVRTARLGLMGTPVQKILDSLLPQWQDSVAISLLMERESLASVVAMIMILLLLTLVRASLRYYGENRLRVYPLHVREQLRRAYQAFLSTAG